MSFCLVLQVKRLRTSHQSHHAWTFVTSVTHIFDAPQLADPNTCWCPHAPAGAAGALHQPGWFVSNTFEILGVEQRSDKGSDNFCPFFFQTALLLKTQSPLFTDEAQPPGGCLGQGAKTCSVDDKWVFFFFVWTEQPLIPPNQNKKLMNSECLLAI